MSKANVSLKSTYSRILVCHEVQLAWQKNGGLVEKLSKELAFNLRLNTFQSSYIFTFTQVKKLNQYLKFYKTTFFNTSICTSTWVMNVATLATSDRMSFNVYTLCVWDLHSPCRVCSSHSFSGRENDPIWTFLHPDADASWQVSWCRVRSWNKWNMC